jgi:predicted amidohydrolase
MSTSTGKKRVAAIAQLRSTSNKFQNLIDVAVCARLAKAQGASMLFLPECFGFIGESAAQTLEEAGDPVLEDTNVNEDTVTESLISTLSGGATSDANAEDGKRIHVLDGLRSIARESGLWISAGGMHVSGAPPDDATGNSRVYNTHVILDEQGDVKAIYRKIHLFDVSIPGKVQLRESATTAPGAKLVVCDSPIGTVQR